MSKKLIGGKYVKCTGICRYYLDMKKGNAQMLNSFETSVMH